MINNVIIRQYKQEDFQAIADIEKECFSLPWSVIAIEEFAECEFSHIFVAEFGGKVVGYLTFTSIFDELQIANIAVSEKYRRLHLATQLIEMLINYGVEKLISVITLEVRISNSAAINFYSKMGFVAVGERKGYYSHPREDALLMNYEYTVRKEI